MVINELIIAVNISLGNDPLDKCLAVDVNADGEVAINELIVAVLRATLSCTADLSTPTPLSTPSSTHSPSPTSTSTVSATPTEVVTPSPTPSFAFGIIDIGPAAVVNELDRSVSFVRRRTRGPARGADPGPDSVTIALDGIPRAIDVSPDGRFAYVTTRSPNRVAVIDTTAMQVIATLSGLGELPEALGCTPDGANLYVTNFGSDTVSLLKLSSLESSLAATRTSAVLTALDLGRTGGLTTIDVGSQPNSLAVTADSAFAYVTNFGTRSVSLVSTTEGRELKPIEVGINPNDVAISADASFAYVSEYGSTSISVISMESNETVDNFSVDLIPFAMTLPTGLSITPQGLLYVISFNLASSELFGSILVFDTRAELATKPRLVERLDFREMGMPGTLPVDVKVSPFGDTVLVSNFLVAQDGQGLNAPAAGGSVLSIDSLTSEVVDIEVVGDFPVSLAPGPGMGVAPPTPTAGAGTPTPTGLPGEDCGGIRCVAPGVCVRDISCHKNGCVPHDKCCPADDHDCTACRGGDLDGMACNVPADCPGGTCEK